VARFRKKNDKTPRRLLNQPPGFLL